MEIISLKTNSIHIIDNKNAKKILISEIHVYTNPYEDFIPNQN